MHEYGYKLVIAKARYDNQANFLWKSSLDQKVTSKALKIYNHRFRSFYFDKLIFEYMEQKYQKDFFIFLFLI